jgi:hypothetical protein
LKATQILNQKMILNHRGGQRLSVFEFVVWAIPKSKEYPEGVKYRAWLSENGITVFGFDNHKPKGPHLHVGDREVGYVYRGPENLKADIRAMIEKEGFIYEE